MTRALLSLLMMVQALAIASCGERGEAPERKSPPGSVPATSPAATGPAGGALFPGDTLAGWRVSHWSGVDVPQRMPGEAWTIPTMTSTWVAFIYLSTGWCL